ncbi:MAG: endonuclease/exonuclease/phosphatase family protein [Planctomycetota bacterium]
MIVSPLVTLVLTAAPGPALDGPSHLEPVPEDPAAALSVLAWNIWHGGREDGEDVGPARVVDVIRESGADLVAMQETYGSGERIAEALEFEFHPRGTNVSIFSRYPIVEDISVFEEFKCAGALVGLPGGRRLAFYSVWLPYSGEIWAAETRDTGDPASMLAACEASAADLAAMWAGIEERLSAQEYEGVPIVIAGDFNSMSHLDYGEVGVDQYEVVVDWPTSHVLAAAGFRDAYRECNPRIDRRRDATWTPRFPDQEQDRIDFVHYRPGKAPADRWRATESRVIREHPDGFPSDHAAVLARFRVELEPRSGPLSLRAATYNIHHAAGTDGALDLERIANVLRGLDADVIALQEVDLGVARSGRVSQPLELAESLSMHPAFGAFMDYQGGRYGMAVLSRFPIVDVEPVPLPDGNEPRIALSVDVRLPNGEVLTVVGVHFDWVDDDAFRFAQAKALAEHLDGLDRPYMVLGDLNDGPASRTLDLIRKRAFEAKKPDAARATFPSSDPESEIDYVFCAPAGAWTVERVRVADERAASDHRPVWADLVLED